MERVERFLKALDFTEHSNDSQAPTSANSAPPVATASAENPGPHRSSNGTPASVSQLAPAPQQHEAARKPKDASSAKAIRLLWCDTGGIRRCRVISGRRYAACQSTGLGITTACMAMPAFADSPVPVEGASVVGEARMKPVEATRVDLPWCPGHQMALVEFEAPRTESPWDLCPRTALKRTCKMLLDNFGLTLKAGFEIEFILLERVPPLEVPKSPPTSWAMHGRPYPWASVEMDGPLWRPVDAALYCQSSAMDRQAAVLDDMVEAVEAMGVEVIQWHAESAKGQYEIALSYSDPVDAADKLLLAREALVGVAGRHGLAVSFLPKPYPDGAGSGCHVHLSLWKDGKIYMQVPSSADPASSSSSSSAAAAAGISAAAASSDPQQQPTAAAAPAAATSSSPPAPSSSSSPPRAPPPAQPTTQGGTREVLRDWSSRSSPSPEMLWFLAGLHTYLDVVVPFTAPSPNSYKRLRPGTWAGGHAAWGYNNREASLRLTAPGPAHLDQMHLEVKCVDSTANPYMALAALTVAGMLGMFTRAPLREPCQVPPQELDAEAAERLGVRPLPSSLEMALQLLQDAGRGETFRAAMAEAIGAPLLRAYLAVRQAEAKHAPYDDRLADLLLRYS